MQRGHYPHRRQRGLRDERRRYRPPETPGGRIARWALLAVATVVAALGLGQMALAVTGATEGPQSKVDMDGLSAVADSASWIEHAHENPAGSGAGYQMPLSMMPGMPEGGTKRLAVALTLTNTSKAFRPVDPVGEFLLRDTDGGTWAARVDTFGDLSRLPAGSQVDGTLFFDVPDEHAQLSEQDPASHQGAGHFYLEWLHDGMTMRLTLPLNGPAPDHSHGT